MEPNNQIILSHSGKQHSYHVAKSLKNLGYLKKFHTSSYITSKYVQKIISKSDNQFWSKRFLDGLDSDSVSANWRFEIRELFLRKFGNSGKIIENAVYQRDEKFDRYIASKLLKLNNPIFWGFQGSSLKSLKSTKTKGGMAICELATAHVTFAQEILAEEMKLMPEWAETISNVEFPSDYQKRLEEEPFVADKVIAASTFTVNSLLKAGLTEGRIFKLPLGTSVEHIAYNPKKSNISNRALKLLYAGTLTQRKGIAYLLEAMNCFNNKDVELHCIGHKFGGESVLRNFSSSYNYVGPMSQQELFKKYSEYDALVLPTLFEGFALVIVEAMAAGLPVITTSHSIGPDIIEDDKNGYIIPIRDVNSIVEAISKLRSKSDDQYHEMRVSSRESALNYSWTKYEHNLSNFLKSL